MKEKVRGFLGFLGLVEDEYGEYGPSNAPRPFSEQPEDAEPEWSNAPAPAARTFPTQPATPSPYRTTTPSVVPQRPTAISVLDGQDGAQRIRPVANPNAPRGSAAFSQERDIAFVSPVSYDDSRRITDFLRANRAVVLTTLDVDQGLARRLVDFTAGTSYALNAKVEMLIRGVYLISPNGTHIGPEAKERLRATDFHNVDQA